MSDYELRRTAGDGDDRDRHSDDSIVPSNPAGRRVPRRTDQTRKLCDWLGISSPSSEDAAVEEMGLLFGDLVGGGGLVVNDGHELTSPVDLEGFLDAAGDRDDEDEGFDLGDEDNGFDFDDDDGDGEDDGPLGIEGSASHLLESDVEYDDRLPSKCLPASDCTDAKRLPMIQNPDPDR